MLCYVFSIYLSIYLINKIDEKKRGVEQKIPPLQPPPIQKNLKNGGLKMIKRGQIGGVIQVNF